VAAHPIADQDRALPAERVDHGQQIGGVFGGVGRRNRPLALAMPALIEREDVEPISKSSRHPIEPVGVGGPTVQHEDAGARRAAPLERMQRELPRLNFRLF